MSSTATCRVGGGRSRPPIPIQIIGTVAPCKWRYDQNTPEMTFYNRNHVCMKCRGSHSLRVILPSSAGRKTGIAPACIIRYTAASQGHSARSPGTHPLPYFMSYIEYAEHGKNTQTVTGPLIARKRKSPGFGSVYKSKDPPTASTSTRRSVVRSIAYRNASGSWAIAGQVL